MTNYPDHGGNIYYFGRNLNLNPFTITDMSASVNPFAKDYLKEALPDPYFFLQFYPDPECTELRLLLCEKLQIKEDSILLGNGSIELIKTVLLWHVPEGANVFLPQPTFTAYRKYLNMRKDLKVFSPFSLDRSKWLESLDEFLGSKSSKKVVLLCNPNNPTCWLFRRAELTERILRYPDVLFLIDEAFIDFCEEESLSELAPRLSNLIVFRSLTKFYGLAGVRAGYLISNSDRVRNLSKFHSMWEVNTLSQIFATILLKDQLFRIKTKEFFLKEVKRFEEFLRGEGIWHSVGPVNFIFFRIEKGEEFWRWLLEEWSILIRSCANFEGLNGDYLRVSLREREANERFLEALKQWLRRS